MLSGILFLRKSVASRPTLNSLGGFWTHRYIVGIVNTVFPSHRPYPTCATGTFFTPLTGSLRHPGFTLLWNRVTGKCETTPQLLLSELQPGLLQTYPQASKTHPCQLRTKLHKNHGVSTRKESHNRCVLTLNNLRPILPRYSSVEFINRKLDWQWVGYQCKFALSTPT